MEKAHWAGMERWGRKPWGPGESSAKVGWRKGELNGKLVGTWAEDGNTTGTGRKDGRAEGLMDLAEWIDGERLEITQMSGG